MTKFVNVTPDQEAVTFVAWGKYNTKHDKDTQFLVKAGETIEGVVLELKDTAKGYKKILKMKVKSIDTPLLILGKDDLNEKLEKGGVKANDLIRLTFVEIIKTKKDRSFYKFNLAIAQA